MMIRIAHVLWPVDFSENSQHALDHAAAIARWYEARLTLLYVFANLPTMDLPPVVLEDADRERLLSDLPVFGSTTHHVMGGSTCPVLIVRRS
jgi:nucleotide-binding universal stress UspA family protein